VSEPTSLAKLSMLGIVGQGVAYLVAVVMARHLGVEGFEAYVVASAVFVLMVTFAPRGFDKFALQILPSLLERDDWGRAHGYIRFGVRRTLWTSLCIGTILGVWGAFARDFAPDTRWAILVSCASLPAGALVHFALEVLTATGRAFTATVIFRLAVPALVLASVVALLSLSVPPSGAIAVGCWGVAWIAALVMMTVTFRQGASPQLLRALPIEEPSSWEKSARPFWIYRISIAVSAQAGVIALEWLQPSASAVGAYAAAMGTAGLALVLATATNRVYARRLAILLEQQDFDTVLALRRQRLRWLAIPITLYLAGTFAFARELLALFRPEFVDEGAVALRVLALATAFVVLFALSPTYLKFRRRHRTTFVTVAIAAAAQIALLLLLVPAWGATGAACAYALAMCGMYGNFARLAHRDATMLEVTRESA
jgi:O-antigen/teichoic acid export membrane protein